MVTGFSSLGLKGKRDVLARQGCHLEALGKKLLPRSFRLLARVISFQLLVRIRSLFFCWILARSYFLALLRGCWCPSYFLHAPLSPHRPQHVEPGTARLTSTGKLEGKLYL